MDPLEMGFVYLGGGIVALVLIGLYWRWVHQVDKRNRYLEAQIKLLGKIAEKNGVSQDEIEGIYNTAAAK